MKSYFFHLAATLAILLAPAMALGQAKPAAKENGAAEAKDRPQLAKFQQASDAWKQLHGDLLTLQSQYRAADAAQRVEIGKKWDELVAKAPAMQDQLIAAAKAAYLEAANTNENVTALLLTVLAEQITPRRFGAGLRVGKDAPGEEVRRPAAWPAGRRGGLRERQLRRGPAAAGHGAKNGSLREAIAAAQGIDACKIVVASHGAMAAYKAAWEKEQKIRQAEAKADDLPRPPRRPVKATSNWSFLKTRPRTARRTSSPWWKGAFTTA